jgi:glycosyltransferase involved in cell wall biosynthesis
MTSKNRLSVIIITKNEANNIKRCLDSVTWADEIIVVDSGSTDNTVVLCQQYTSQVLQTDWPGYGPQKNRALQQATGDWVLALDADEQVSIPLREKIQTLIQQADSKDAYAIKRPVVFYGQLIKHACGADQTVRLFKRGKAKFSDDIVHETVVVDGLVGKINQPIYHYSFNSIAAILAKMNKYTDLVAEQRAACGKHGSIFKAVTHASWMFIRVYLLKAGFLDGKAGFVLAMSFAQGAYYRYIKLLYVKQDPYAEFKV